MAGDIRERVGSPTTTNDVEVKLHDAVYNFGRAKYLGLDAHLGAICVANGWLDKVKVHVDEKTGKRSFKLPFIYEGQKIKMPEAGKLKELDQQAFKYWNEKYPVKAGPKAPKGPGDRQDPKDPKTPDGHKDPKEPAPSPLPGKDKKVSEVEAAKKAEQHLQTDLMCRNNELDKGIGSIFGHGADTIANMFGHGSDKIRKSLNEKQNQIKAMGKYANEGKLDEFGKLHKSLTGAEFDPSKTACLNVEQDFKEFQKHHTARVEDVTDLASFAANTALMFGLGKAKGITGLVKQGLLMTGFSGAVKAGLKASEHDWDLSRSGWNDFQTGAGSGLAFFAGGKVTNGVHSAFKAQTWQKYLLRGALSGGSGGLVYGAIEGPNLGAEHARNEGRKYDLNDGFTDSGRWALASAGSGALLGAAFGGGEYWLRRSTSATLKLGKLPTPKTEAPKPKTETPPPKTETPPPQAEALTEEAIRAMQAHRVQGASNVKGLYEAKHEFWQPEDTQLYIQLQKMYHPDRYAKLPEVQKACDNFCARLNELRSEMKQLKGLIRIDKTRAGLKQAWEELVDVIYKDIP